MISKFWWVNFLLVITLVIIVAGIIMIWQNKIVLPGSDARKTEKQWPEISSFEPPVKAKDQYDMIAAKNMYNSARKEHILKSEPEKRHQDPVTPAKKEEKPKQAIAPEQVEILNKKDLILYGVILMADYRFAFVNDLDKGDKGAQIKVKETDRIGEYAIKKIFPEFIIVSYQGTSYRVPLFKEKEGKSTQKKVAKNNGPAPKEFPEKKGASDASPRIFDTKAKNMLEPKRTASSSNDDEYEWVTLNTPFGKKRIKRKK